MKELIDFFFDNYPEQFQGNREYWYSLRSGKDIENVTAALSSALDTMSPEQRTEAVDFMYASAPDIFQGEKEYWYTDPAEGRDDLLTAFGKAFSESPVTTTSDDVVGVEGAEGTPGIMAGGTIHRVDNPSQEDFYIVEYEYPTGSGHSFFYRFDSLETLEAAVGPGLGGGSIAVGPVVTESSLGEWTDAGHASEVTGVTGSFDAYINDIIRDVSAAAGIGDPTIAGAALNDPDIQILMAKGAEAGWNEAQYKAEMRKTDYYKNVLYPGIENFYAQTDDPERAYNTYVSNIGVAAKTLGLTPGADGTYKAMSADLLGAGVTDTAFAEFVPIYQKAETNAGYATQLSKWTQAYTGATIDSFSDWYDVLAGNSPAEVQEIAEAAGLSYVAENVGYDVSDTQVRLLAEQADISEAQARQGFGTAAKSMLSLGDRGLARYGLTSQEIVDASFGVSTTGGDIEELRQRISKTATELGLQDDEKAQFYASFGERGQLIKPGLAATAPEAG